MASWWQKGLATAAGVAGLAGGAYYFLLKRPLPKQRRTLTITGIHEPVKIVTDRYGVPHIYAQNEDDLFFSQGYIHAQDRLWQMDFNRRTSSGRLSEIFGELALETDRFTRRLGIHRSAHVEAANLKGHIYRVMDAYARGVNYFIRTHQGNLPIEFRLLNFSPELWTISDSIQWAKLIGWNLSGNWETELIRARLVARLGPERAAQLESGYGSGHPLVLPPGVEYQGVNLDLLEQYQQIKEMTGFGIMGGSNNWVVDGTMTVTGAPILCNDPHLGQAIPSVWHECHLSAGDIDVVGASFPGTPGVVIGHNRFISWGVTNAVSDVQDLYIEKFNPDNPYQYKFQGRWEEAEIVHEEITVRGRKEPVIEEVRITRHGPILTNLPEISGASGEQPRELPLALRWTGLEHCTIPLAIQKVNRATNWEEFKEALRNWDVPPQNVVYADRAGNIGYVMAGTIPIRSKGQALLPSPGWTGEHEWTGFIPFEELPQTYNPEQHFIATANNRVVDESYPYYISNEWFSGYRAGRIRDLLREKSGHGKLSLSDMAAIQSDQYSLPAVEIVPFMLQARAASTMEREAQALLRDWDYQLSPESVGASIYTTFLRKLEHILFATVIGDDETLLHSYLGIGSTLLALTTSYAWRNKPLIIHMLKTRDESWFANSIITNGPTTWDQAITSAFQAAIDELSKKLGASPSDWRYGKIHKVTFGHALGLVKPLNLIFNRGPYPFGGDIDTVNLGASRSDNPEQIITVPSFRAIINMADVNASLSIHAPGQSGQLGSKHYSDYIKRWLRTEHHPMLFLLEDVEANAERTVHFQPEK